MTRISLVDDGVGLMVSVVGTVALWLLEQVRRHVRWKEVL